MASNSFWTTPKATTRFNPHCVETAALAGFGHKQGMPSVAGFFYITDEYSAYLKASRRQIQNTLPIQLNLNGVRMSTEHYLRKKYIAFPDTVHLFNIDYVIDETHCSDNFCMLMCKKMFGTVPKSFSKEMFITLCVELLKEEVASV